MDGIVYQVFTGDVGEPRTSDIGIRAFRLNETRAL